jgi:hypothetical protein
MVDGAVGPGIAAGSFGKLSLAFGGQPWCAICVSNSAGLLFTSSKGVRVLGGNVSRLLNLMRHPYRSLPASVYAQAMPQIWAQLAPYALRNSFRYQLSPSKYKDSASSSPNVDRMVVKVRIDPRTTAFPREIWAKGNMRRSKRNTIRWFWGLVLLEGPLMPSGVCKYLKTQRFVEWHRRARKHEPVQPEIRFSKIGYKKSINNWDFIAWPHSLQNAILGGNEVECVRSEHTKVAVNKWLKTFRQFRDRSRRVESLFLPVSHSPAFHAGCSGQFVTCLPTCLRRYMSHYRPNDRMNKEQKSKRSLNRVSQWKMATLSS